ncbi:MAG: hypothetical protein P8P29_06765 [Flavobacteriaceae bacterium]|nr:hypothetical protein [Flavobacteriaceae bacterium]
MNKGDKFGRLTITGDPYRISAKDRSYKYECLCECGNIKHIRRSELKKGTTNSCGCIRKEQLIARNTSHGDSKSRLYEIWSGIKKRCTNPKAHNYIRYGGRGITVCNDWFNSYESFKKWALLNGYSDTLTIERKNNNLHYTPDNCKWATVKEQNRNKRSNVNITYQGKTQILSDWANELNIKRQTLSKRYHKGLTGVDLFKPV